MFVLLFCIQVEQYGTLIFHGLEGSCQEYIANVVARCIKVITDAERTENENDVA